MDYDFTSQYGYCLEDESCISAPIGQIDPEILFNGIMKRIKNRNLSVAIVAIAWGESRFLTSAVGDSGAYAKAKKESICIQDIGLACSFGLLQYNICGGFGAMFLEEHYNGEDNVEKVKVLTDPWRQIDFLANYLEKNYQDQIALEKSVKEWIEWYLIAIGRGSEGVSSAAEKRYKAAESNGYLNFGI